MENKIRFTNKEGETFESVTKGTSEEIRAVFGDEFKGLLAPMNRINSPALPPAPVQHYLPEPAPAPEIRTVIQEDFEHESESIDPRLQALEREVEQARANGQWNYPPVPAPQPPQPVHAGNDNPTVQPARAGSARLLTLCRNPWFWFDFVIFPILVLASLPATKPFVAGMPLVGQPIVGVMDIVVKAVSQPPKPAAPEKPKPSPKGDAK